MAGKDKELTPDEARDKQRHDDDRQAELERQAEQEAAMQAFYADSAAAAQKALNDQIEYETHGIRVVEGKP